MIWLQMRSNHNKSKMSQRPSDVNGQPKAAANTMAMQRTRDLVGLLGTRIQQWRSCDGKDIDKYPLVVIDRISNLIRTEKNVTYDSSVKIAWETPGYPSINQRAQDNEFGPQIDVQHASEA